MWLLDHGHGPPETPVLAIYKSDFFQIPSVRSKIGLGHQLVTIRVLWHPWGPT